MSENQEAVSHKEFETRLVRLPFQIFLLIAENDENVDTNEWMAFIKILKEKKVCDSPYARGVLGKTEDKLQALKLGYERKEIKNDPEISHVSVIGPSKHGAQLEGSKEFAKKFMSRHNIPTASYKSFDKSSESTFLFSKSFRLTTP